jgi:hypothetical protein
LLKYALAFLDAVPDEDRAGAAIMPLATRVDVSAVPATGGVEGEALRPLDLSPRPGSRSRELVSEAQIEAHLDLGESEQDDGGWMFDWLPWSPAQTTDWYGHVTIRAALAARQRAPLRTTSRPCRGAREPGANGVDRAYYDEAHTATGIGTLAGARPLAPRSAAAVPTRIRKSVS